MTEDQISAFASALEDMPAAERQDSFASAVIESGGDWHVMPKDGAPESTVTSLSLYGISSVGIDLDRAIESWISIALRHEVPA